MNSFRTAEFQSLIVFRFLPRGRLRVKHGSVLPLVGLQEIQSHDCQLLLQTLLFDAHTPLFGKNNMVEHVDADDPSGLFQPIRHDDVLPAGFRVA